jgi:hypothetical protein
MDPLTNVVVLWGGGLLFANLIFDPIFSTFRTSITGGSLGASDLNTSPVHMLLVGLLTLIVVSFLSNNNPRIAKTVLWVFTGLTILWLISYNEDKATAAAGTAATTAAKAVTTTFNKGGAKGASS